MIKKNDDRIWIYNEFSKKYYLLGAGLTHMEEVYKTALLETPNINSPLCKREILYHTGQLEFEGFRTDDMGQELLLSKHLKRGNDALITFVIANRKDVVVHNVVKARKIQGYVSIENPGTGEGVLGSRIKGKILYAQMPEEGLFDEESQTFG